MKSNVSGEMRARATLASRSKVLRYESQCYWLVESASGVATRELATDLLQGDGRHSVRFNERLAKLPYDHGKNLRDAAKNRLRYASLAQLRISGESSSCKVSLFPFEYQRGATDTRNTSSDKKDYATVMDMAMACRIGGGDCCTAAA